MNGREAELLRQGWTRRFVAGPPRLTEAIEIYRSLGFAVHLEHPQPEELAKECETCQAALGLFRVVYTRPVWRNPSR